MPLYRAYNINKSSEKRDKPHRLQLVKKDALGCALQYAALLYAVDCKSWYTECIAVGQIARFNFLNIYELLINMQFTCAAVSSFSFAPFSFRSPCVYVCVSQPRERAAHIIFMTIFHFIYARLFFVVSIPFFIPCVCTLQVEFGRFFPFLSLSCSHNRTLSGR